MKNALSENNEVNERAESLRVKSEIAETPV